MPRPTSRPATPGPATPGRATPGPATPGPGTPGPAAPAGFPHCGRCPYRDADLPHVCLACFRRATSQGATARGAGTGSSGCAACGMESLGPGPCPNPWCGRADRSWSVAFAVGVHRGPLRRVLVDYKYRGQRRWAPILARLVAGWLHAHEVWLEEFDLLVPVPSYLGPGARRSWDPLGELSSRIATLVGPLWDVNPGTVIKTADTPPMSGRSWTSRLALAEGPLRASLSVPDPALVDGARVLVLDDVLTEGATLREVARCLRSAGAVEVAGLALTRPTVTGWRTDWSR